MKISPKLLAVIAVLLAAVIAVTWYMHSREIQDTDDRLSVMYDGNEVVSYSLSEIIDMKNITVYADIKSAKAADEKGDYTGVRLDVLLKNAGVSDFETIIFTAGDGYSAAADADETKEILVAYEKDGETLGYFTKGGTGPLRCVMLEDSYGNRSIKYLTEINCIPE